MTAVDWSGIRERVLALNGLPHFAPRSRRGDPRFWLDPVLSQAELAEAHAQLGVELPEEYQGFLLEVGSGACGLGMGMALLPLVKEDGRWYWQWEDRGIEVSDLAVIGEVFPATSPPTAYDFDPYWTQGTLHLNDCGCALWDLLVVTGPERGYMWSDNRSDGLPLVPLRLPGRERVTFYDWFLAWLHRMEAR